MAKVLVIDDNLDSAQTLIWAMEAAGHEAMSVNNGEEALSKVKYFIPDIILCDINMPGINGYDVCKKLKTDKRLADTLIFAQTAYDTVDKKMRSIDAGFDYHFVKPVDIRKLTNFIETALQPQNG